MGTIFFFKQKTAYEMRISDWSSDVCSSDLELRPAVPRADGQARRRLHRGSLAGHLDRPEVCLAQPAIHRGHDHRGLRLPPPDRKSVGSGKSVSVRVDLGGRRIIKKKINNTDYESIPTKQISNKYTST